MPMGVIYQNQLTSKFSFCWGRMFISGDINQNVVFSLLDISGDQGTTTTNDTQYTTQNTPAESFVNIQPTPTGVPSKDTH